MSEDNLTKVVWREWYNKAAVKQLTEMGTLPRNENMLDIRWENGKGVARMIAEDAWNNDSESFREGGELVIIEPIEFAGTYDISVDYEPVFYAYQRDSDEE